MSILTSTSDWNPSSAWLTVFTNPRLHVYPVNLLFLLKDIKSTIPGFKSTRVLQVYINWYCINTSLAPDSNIKTAHNLPPQHSAAAYSLLPCGQHGTVSLSRNLGLKLHLCIGLVQPAVKVGGQKQRLLLLQRQTVPPVLLLLLDLDVHLTLSGFMANLESVKKKMSCCPVTLTNFSIPLSSAIHC